MCDPVEISVGEPVGTIMDLGGQVNADTNEFIVSMGRVFYRPFAGSSGACGNAVATLEEITGKLVFTCEVTAGCTGGLACCPQTTVVNGWTRATCSCV